MESWIPNPEYSTGENVSTERLPFIYDLFSLSDISSQSLFIFNKFYLNTNLASQT